MTHNRSMHDAPDPWRASLRASRERRAADRRARRWTFRRRGVAACAAAVVALSGGAAVAGNGGTTPSQGDDASASSVTLKPGSRGTNVKRLQRKLRVQASGYYGSLTKKAVKRFQKRARPEGRRRRRARHAGQAAPARHARVQPGRRPAADRTSRSPRSCSASPSASPAATRAPSRPTAPTAASTSSTRRPGRRWGHRRPRRGPRVRPGPPGGQAVQAARQRPLGPLRRRVGPPQDADIAVSLPGSWPS